MGALYFYFPPNPLSGYYLIGVGTLLLIWSLYSIIKIVLAEVRKPKSKIIYEIVKENGKYFAVKYTIQVKKYTIDKREI